MLHEAYFKLQLLTLLWCMIYAPWTGFFFFALSPNFNFQAGKVKVAEGCVCALG